MSAGKQPARPPRRLTREQQTIIAMVKLYCRDHHRLAAAGKGRRGAALCPDCAALLAYAERRLQGCRYGAAKPTCAACTTHCYKPALREVTKLANEGMVARGSRCVCTKVAPGMSSAITST